MLRIADIVFPIFNPYQKATLEIYFQGCLRNTCTGKCHNPELKDISSGTEMSIEEISKHISAREDLIKCISFSGGDPLYQDEEDLVDLLISLRTQFPNKEYWLFTGENDFESIPTWCKDLFNVIKYGPFLAEFQQEGFPSSSNQTIWKNPDNIDLGLKKIMRI